MQQTPQNPAFFDAIAHDYDTSFTQTKIGQKQREQVWFFLENWLPRAKNASILELNCGTGRDAAWLAEHGFSNVLATDVSEKMLAVASKNSEKKGLATSIRFEKIDLENFEPSDFRGKKFDLIFSNFGGLNCLSPQKMQEIGPKLADLLAPSGRLALVVMGRFCLLESLYFLAKGRFGEAFRRAKKDPALARLDEATVCPTWYFSPREMAFFFEKKGLKKVGLRPVGAFLPPSYLEPFFEKRQAWLEKLAFFEKKWAAPRSWPAHFADHFLIVFENAD